jgi:hypothetical protein
LEWQDFPEDRSMNILYIGKFKHSYSTEVYVTWALRAKGVTVYRCASMRSGNAIIAQINRWNPSAVLFSKLEIPETERVLNHCRRKGILTVCWQWDLFYGYRPKHPAQFKSDILLTTDGGHQDRFERDGYNHSVLRQGIHKPEHQLFNADSYDYDVAFVGTRFGHPSRRRLIAWLERNYGPKFVHLTNTRGLSLNRTLAKVKVVVGDSYPSRRYWSNRVYEITGRGGFLMHPETEGLDEEFSNGCHYVVYDRRDYARLRDQIDYWVANNQEREAIRRQGFAHCGAHYTYSHRVSRLTEIISDALAAGVFCAVAPNP